MAMPSTLSRSQVDPYLGGGRIDCPQDRAVYKASSGQEASTRHARMSSGRSEPSMSSRAAGMPAMPLSGPRITTGAAHSVQPFVSDTVSSAQSEDTDLTERNTAYYQNQLDKTVAPKPSSGSKVLVMSPHCPAALMKPNWNINQFSLKKVLYVGNISRVLHAVDNQSDTAVALKVYKRANLSDMEKYQVAREIRMHSELHHKNIISLYCAWKDSHYVYMAVEWAPAGDLYKMLSRGPGLDESAIVDKLLKPLLSALSFIHSRGLIHRDLKPENILLDAEHNIKLSDFGLSINLNHEVANTRLGTLDYIAPEILDCPYKYHPLQNKDNLALGYDNKVDVWSTGVLAFELIVGHTPFRANSLPETLSKIKENRVIFPPNVPALARDFISTCLQSNPTRRPTVDQLRRHPWLEHPSFR